MTYECSKGHGIDDPPERAVRTTCPVMPHGKPCRGQLKRIGKGSRGVYAQRKGNIALKAA